MRILEKVGKKSYLFFPIIGCIGTVVSAILVTVSWSRGMYEFVFSGVFMFFMFILVIVIGIAVMQTEKGVDE